MRPTPLGRLAHPNDITDRVVPLASPSARWLTRQIIKAPSGWRNCPIGHHPGR